MTITLHHGDALDVLRGMADNSVDAVVTDPPAGIAFMGKTWDQDHGGRLQWVAAFAAIFAEALRVVKPGGHALVWALPRTSHWTGCALEDAGWQIRDCCAHLFGSGFPKSHNLPDGRGTALKPAMELWWLARKPLVGTVAANVLAHGTGALNIEASRVGTDDTQRHNNAGTGNVEYWRTGKRESDTGSPAGRWPANVVLSHSEQCERVGTRRVRVNDKEHDRNNNGNPATVAKGQQYAHVTAGYADADGMEEVEEWVCVDGCPVAELGRQSGERKGATSNSSTKAGHDGTGWGMGDTGGSPGHADTGTAARFFATFAPSPLDDVTPWLYTAKASRREREAGLSRLDSGEIVIVQLHQPNNSSGGATWASEGQQVRLLVDTGQSQPKVIGGYGIPSNVASEWNTFLFGSDTMGLSRMGIKSITATATNSTTTSPTWNYLMRSLTNASIAVVNSETASGGSHADDAGNSNLSLSFTSAKTVFLPGASDVLSGTRWTISVSAKSDSGPSREAANGVSVRNAHPT